MDADCPSLPNVDQLIDMYLNSPIGWGIPFRKGLNGIVIHMSTPETISKMGDRTLSCAELGGRVIHLNVYRWLYGSPASKLPLFLYRQYMVSHELGHILGYEHVETPASGPAPIMIQQTKGIGNCTPNAMVFP